MNVPSINKTTAKTTAAAAGIGAATYGAVEFIGQRNILKNADEFVVNTMAAANRAKSFQTPFFAGSKEASELACKKIDEYAQKAIDFAKGGKFNFKAIAKSSAVGAGVGLAIGAGIVLVKKAIDKAKANKEQA